MVPDPPKTLTETCELVTEQVFEKTRNVFKSRSDWKKAAVDCADLHKRLVEWLVEAKKSATAPVLPASP